MWILAVLSFAIFYWTETVNGETRRRIIVPFGIVFALWCFWLLRRASVAARARGARLSTAFRVAGVVAAVGVGAGILQTALLSEWSGGSARGSTSEKKAPSESGAEQEVSVADACQLLTAPEAEAVPRDAVTQRGPDNQKVTFEGEAPFGTSSCTYEDPNAPAHTIVIFTSRQQRLRTAEDISENCKGGQPIDGIGTAAFWYDPFCSNRGLAAKEMVIANGRDYIAIGFDAQTTLEQAMPIAQVIVSRDT